MFRGRIEQTIDAKGRVILPVKFRDIIAQKYDNAIVVTNFDSCLLAYPTEEWIPFEEKISKLPSGNWKIRSFKRFILSAATECSLDKQGRILIPPSLKSYAHLEHDIVVAGQRNHFEIWNRQSFYENIQHGQDYAQSQEVSEIINELEL